MSKGEETRLKNLRAKKAAKKKLTPQDVYYLEKLEAMEREEARRAAT